MSKSKFTIIVSAVIVAIALSCAFYPISKFSVPKQTESHEILYARDELLLESAKLLALISKQLDRMEQDLKEIKEKLAEENI